MTQTFRRPQVVAHRGASGALAEHTLAAYQQALKDGAEALECDVRLTADGHLVCVHDRRVERTSDGVGVVSVLELAELDTFDFASWKTPWADLDDEHPDPDPDPMAGKVLTLESLLALVRDSEKPVDMAIETKHPTRYAGLVERRLVEVLAKFGWDRTAPGVHNPIRVMSFSWMSMRRVREAAPGLPTVYLMKRVPLRFRDGSLPLGTKIVGVRLDIVRAHPEYVGRAHARGNQVHVFTVNGRADVQWCLDLGVDALITDVPNRTLELVRQYTS
ncbi:MAG: glycerophosphodiester phosphodiesterase [Nocardioidaceae bacterium]